MSPEIITAENFISQRSSSITVDSRKDFCVDGNWSTEPKHRIVVHPQRRPQTKMNFIEKFPTISPEQTIIIWHELKKAGLPVVPTLRRTNKGHLLMTDLSADGSELFGKYYYYTGHERLNWDIINKYLAIDLGKIEEQARFLCSKATDNKVMLAYDDAFETLVHPDGSWQLIMLDLSYVGTGVDKIRQNLENTNELYTDSFLRIQNEMRKNMGKPPAISKWYTWWDSTGI